MGIELALALGLAAAGAGVSAYNTNKTLKKQDAAAAQGIRNQAKLQREADARVNEQVQQLEGSTMADERAKRLDEFMATLAANRGQARGIDAGTLGSAAFQAANDAGVTRADTAAARTAGQLATADAATMQRIGEGVSYGRLATDLGLTQRRASGQQFLDDLRLRRIRRNPGLDVLAGALSGAAGMAPAMAGAGGADIGPVVKEPLVY